MIIPYINYHLTNTNMSSRKVCLNCPTSYYTGKEQSPLHFGLSAEGYEINSIMEGFDKDLWMVEVRNNKKVWTKKEHINKMTFEIPLITESTTPLTLTQKEPDTQKEPEQPSHPQSSLSQPQPQPQSSQDTQKEPEPSSHPQSSHPQSSHPQSSHPQQQPIHSDKEKVSKTIKPTDYTLFITYRIHLMKAVSGDNKKNYDTAREEWKEYKKKPDELRLIMVEANHYHGILNKK